MSNLNYTIDFQPTSIWADVHGKRSVLDKVEQSLYEGLLEAMPAGRELPAGTRLPWIRKSLGHLRILAGILPLVYPNADWSTATPQRIGFNLESELAALGAAGWREYQLDAIAAAVTAPCGRSIISVGTGGGKTRIAYGIARALGGDWLYVVHGIDLVAQAAASFAELAEPLDEILGSRCDISVCGWKKARDMAESGTTAWKGIIIDECHAVPARGRAQTMAAFRGEYRVGLSGTALDRSDDLNPWVIGLLGPIAYDLDVEELTEMGNLAEGKVIVL